jgi:hypothetical protein
MSGISDRVTAFGLKALDALADGPQPGGAAAERMGYKGKTGGAYGGAARAPMYFGRALKSLPAGLVERYYSGRATMYRLTPLGVAARQVLHGRNASK